MKLLFSLLAVFLSVLPQTARAELRFVPSFVYESFSRTKPEKAGVIRIGGGLRVIADTLVSRLAAEAEGLYANESTIFSSENFLRETMVRARTGMNARVFDIRPLAFNLRGGFQFNFINDSYEKKGSSIREITRARHSTAYGGFEVELIPVSGFGILSGATISGHEVLNKWIIQYYLGIVLR